MARFFFFILILAAMLPSANLFAQGKADANAPIHIEADRMVSKQKENAVIFTGNVEAKQGGLTIHSDEMTVYHKDQPESTEAQQQAGAQKIEKLHAVGNVEIIQQGLVATGNQMRFFADERKVLITGNTKVWQGSNLVTGEKIMLDLRVPSLSISQPAASSVKIAPQLYMEYMSPMSAWPIPIDSIR